MLCLNAAAATACGETFSAAPGASGRAGAAGAAGLGVSGDAGRGGAGNGGALPGGSSNGGSSNGGTTANAGSAGSSASCSCGAGQYCRAGACRDCADLSSLEFAEPEPIFENADDNLRFPREGERPLALFFRRGTDAAARLWYSDDHTSLAPVALDPTTTWPESGLVYLGDEGGRGFNVLFDVTDAEGRRAARRGRFETELSEIAVVEAPLGPRDFDLYEIAISIENQRVFWMSTASGVAELRTGILGSDATEVVDLMLPARGGAACARGSSDATPWVTRDGRLLLFRAPAFDAECQAIESEGNDLYVVPIGVADGMALGNAVALESVNLSANDQTDPSFAPDLCTLYFASKPVGDDAFALFRSTRR